MNLYFSLFIVQNFNWNLEKHFTIWHTLMSPISRSILSNFVLSARFIYATRSFSCCFFLSRLFSPSLNGAVTFSMEKENVVCDSTVLSFPACNLILAILLLQAALFQQEWKRHLSSTISKCKEIRFFFFSAKSFL